jgi:hypothetical protein
VEPDPVKAALVAEARQQRGTVRPPGPPGVGVRDLLGLDLVDGLDRQYARPGAKDAAGLHRGPAPAPEGDRDLTGGDPPQVVLPEEHGA